MNATQDNTRGSFWLSFSGFVFMNCTTICLQTLIFFYFHIVKLEKYMDKVERTEDIWEKMVNMAILVKYRSLDLIDTWTEKHRKEKE